MYVTLEMIIVLVYQSNGHSLQASCQQHLFHVCFLLSMSWYLSYKLGECCALLLMILESVAPNDIGICLHILTTFYIYVHAYENM